MAIVFLQQKKSQRNLAFLFIGIVLVLVLILVTPAILSQPFFKDNFLFSKQEPRAASGQVQIDFSVLKNPLIKELDLFTEIKPLERSEGASLGRENPFLPF